VPAGLGALADELELVTAGMPAAKLELDQTHCTVGTKLRRVLRMHEAGALARPRGVLLRDDDLISLALAPLAPPPPTAPPPPGPPGAGGGGGWPAPATCGPPPATGRRSGRCRWS